MSRFAKPVDDFSSEKEMDVIADFMARVLIEKQSPAAVGEDVIEFRQGYQTLYYNFDHALPPQ